MSNPEKSKDCEQIPQTPRDNAASYELPILQAHFQRIAKRLAAEGEAARSFDQGTNRGQIREAFIRELLSHNTSPLTGIGTGEIIHPNSTVGLPKRQIDVVVHNNRYPKISLATGIDLFFIETVSSFVEIKSRLTKEHIRRSASTTREIKSNAHLDGQHFNPTGMVENPRPYSFVFAYEGPKSIKTVLGWMKEVAAEHDYGIDDLKKTDGDNREFFNHQFIDGVFVLGKGFVCLDSLPHRSWLEIAHGWGHSVSIQHVWVSNDHSELIYLWLLINLLSEKLLWNNIELGSYLGFSKIDLSD